MEHIKVQKEIKDRCEEFRNALNDMYQWEKEIKEMESRIENVEDEKVLPVRSHVQQIAKRENQNINKRQKFATSTEEKLKGNKLADSFKEKGNNCVKLGQYEKAIEYYSNAIKEYDKDPIFYTNRALCYLKLERYNECMADCNIALKLNPKAVKAFYRRMQAYEALGENEEALNDCKVILDLQPKNKEAKSSLERIIKRLEKVKFENQEEKRRHVNTPKFTPKSDDMIEIELVDKPPHLRSKKPLKKVRILDSNKAISKKEVQESSTKPTKIEKPEEHLISINKKKSLPPPPQSPAQFYVSWRDLSNDDKYLYLKSIEPSKINTIVGASLESELLSQILQILSDYYIKDGIDVVKILSQLSKHSEMVILSLFLSAEDKKALNKLIDFMENKCNCKKEEITEIKEKFNL